MAGEWRGCNAREARNRHGSSAIEEQEPAMTRQTGVQKPGAGNAYQDLK
jgi:hypothetical protein